MSQSSLHFTVRTSDTEFTLAADDNLLSALERTGHQVEYQCRSGYCGSCRLVLESGKVSYPNAPMAFLNANEILPCCCRLESDVKLVCKLLCQADK